MADRSIDPHDDSVRSVPLPSEDRRGADQVVAQQNQSPGVAVGGGEWPSTGTPPTGPAPGTTADGVVDRPARPPGDPVDGPPPGTRTRPDLQQDGRAAGDRGPARLGDAGLPEGGAGEEFPPVKDVLESDPVPAGSGSVPTDDRGRDSGPTKFS